MLERLKKVLVESYVGAIGLGWIFANAALHLASVFSSPISAWLMRREVQGITNQAGAASFSIRDGVPDLVRFLCLLMIGYVLLRWLYFSPPTTQPSDSVPR